MPASATLHGTVHDLKNNPRGHRPVERLRGLAPCGLTAGRTRRKSRATSRPTRKREVARLYANENFPKPVVEALRAMGHDALTTAEAGRSDQVNGILRNTPGRGLLAP